MLDVRDGVLGPAKVTLVGLELCLELTVSPSHLVVNWPVLTIYKSHSHRLYQMLQLCVVYNQMALSR